MDNRVRIVSRENVVTNAEISLRDRDGNWHDVRHCVTGATVTLKVGEISRAHLEFDAILVDADAEAYTLDEETLQVFAHQLREHGWAVVQEPAVR